MIIGGVAIYEAALPRAGIIHLTEVHGDFEGEARLAPFDRDVWIETDREEHTTSAGLAYSFVTLVRRA